MPRYVAVVGPGEGATEVEIRRAEQVGRLLAERGVVVLTGGLGGVMAAAARGAQRAGGRTVGLLPGADRPATDADADADADAVTIAIPTGLGEARNAVLVRAADALIAIGGSWGTLSEVALARRADLPVVSLGGWRVSDHHGRELDILTVDSAARAVMVVCDEAVRSTPLS